MTILRGLFFVTILILLSPLLLPCAIVGVVAGTCMAGFKVGYQGVVYFLLTFKARRNLAANGLGGVAFSRQHPKGRRH